MATSQGQPLPRIRRAPGVRGTGRSLSRRPARCSPRNTPAVGADDDAAVSAQDGPWAGTTVAVTGTMTGSVEERAERHRGGPTAS
ncbi:hypothetical protein AB0A81_12190 [Streptomyces flaveolus]|uniref:Uncharacterized protein n=1 Tax=Streptomyces flaveolus TaxID=67297 RepID=A0ABV1VIU5_9ACTN